MPKIDKLPEAVELSGNEHVPISQNGKTVRVPLSRVSAQVAIDAAQFADMDLSGKENDHIIYYDELAGKWLTKPMTITGNVIDGGTY
ncbi:MAG: hypothetical protein ACTSXQ_06085 [Alphaproteobacteria bacterium]